MPSDHNEEIGLDDKIEMLYDIASKIYSPWVDAIDPLTKNFLYSAIFKGIDPNEFSLHDNVSREELLKNLENKLKTGQIFFSELASVYEHSILDVPLLIIGETGTGKELMARSIHDISHRKGKPYKSFNAAAIPSGLVESELFGYKKDSHNKADKDKVGLIATANEGTLFIDEIGKMPLNIQYKLLRFLETKEILPVGAVTPEEINVRIISAIQPKELEDENKFLPDLKYRLGYPDFIFMPPLRDLIAHYGNHIIDITFKRTWEKIQPDSNENYLKICETCYTILKKHNYKGNFRELENILRGAIISTLIRQVDEIQPEDLPLISLAEVGDNGNIARNNLGDETPDILNIKLSKICDYVEETASKWIKEIVTKRVIHAIEQSGNLKNALELESIPSNKYQKYRDRIMKLTGKKISDMKLIE